MLITIAGQKGGAGKSTVAINLAAECMRRGYRTLLVDADPQGSALTWAAVASENGHDAPRTVALGDNIRKELPGLAEEFDVTVVDCPGRLGRRQALAMTVSDLVIVPCPPAVLDVWALSESLEQVQDVMSVRPDMAACLLVTQKPARTILSRTIRETLGETGLPIMNSELSSLQDYVQAVGVGRGVTTYKPKGKAAAQVRALLEEIEAMAVEVNDAAE